MKERVERDASVSASASAQEREKIVVGGKEGCTGGRFLYLNPLGFASSSKHGTHIGMFGFWVSQAPKMPVC